MTEENAESEYDIDITSAALTEINLEQGAMFTDAKSGNDGMIVEFVSRLSEGVFNAAKLVIWLDRMPAFQETTAGMTDERREDARKKILKFLKGCISFEVTNQNPWLARDLSMQAIIRKGKFPEKVSINLQRLKAQLLGEKGSITNEEEEGEGHVDTLIRVLSGFQEEVLAHSDVAFTVQEVHERLKSEHIKDLDIAMDFFIEYISKMATRTVLRAEETFRSASKTEKELQIIRLYHLFVKTLRAMIDKPA